MSNMISLSHWGMFPAPEPKIEPYPYIHLTGVEANKLIRARRAYRMKRFEDAVV